MDGARIEPGSHGERGCSPSWQFLCRGVGSAPRLSRVRLTQLTKLALTRLTLCGVSASQRVAWFGVTPHPRRMPQSPEVAAWPRQARSRWGRWMHRSLLVLVRKWRLSVGSHPLVRFRLLGHFGCSTPRAANPARSHALPQAISVRMSVRRMPFEPRRSQAACRPALISANQERSA